MYNHKFGRKMSFVYNQNHLGCSFDQRHIKYEIREEEYNIFHISHLVIDAETELSDDELDYSEYDNL